MISVACQRKRKPAGWRNAPTPQRLAQGDAPIRVPAGGLRDPLDLMRVAGELHEEHVRAAQWFRQLTEAALTGRGVNDHFRADRRRGYRASTPLPTAVMSRMELETIREHLGESDFRLLADAIVGRPAKDIARLRYALGQIDRREWRSCAVAERTRDEAA